MYAKRNGNLVRVSGVSSYPGFELMGLFCSSYPKGDTFEIAPENEQGMLKIAFCGIKLYLANHTS